MQGLQSRAVLFFSTIFENLIMIFIDLVHVKNSNWGFFLWNHLLWNHRGLYQLLFLSFFCLSVAICAIRILRCTMTVELLLKPMCSSLYPFIHLVVCPFWFLLALAPLL